MLIGSCFDQSVLTRWLWVEDRCSTVFLWSYLCQCCTQWWLFFPLPKIVCGLVAADCTNIRKIQVWDSNSIISSQASSDYEGYITLFFKQRTTWQFWEWGCCSSNSAICRPSRVDDDLLKTIPWEVGLGTEGKIKESVSVLPPIFICSTWKGNVCYIDKNRQLLLESVPLVSRALVSLRLSWSTCNIVCN